MSIQNYGIIPRSVFMDLAFSKDGIVDNRIKFSLANVDIL